MIDGVRPPQHPKTLFSDLEGAETSFSLENAPNPKPTSADKKSYGRLASLYTAFSTDFARHVLELCASAGYHEIIDPFSGMGTLGEAARNMPLQLTLNDLNPFATLSSVFRTSQADDILAAVARVQSIRIAGASEPDMRAFLNLLAEQLEDGATALDIVQASGKRHRAAALVIHLICLIRMASHKRLKGSNPTWTKRANNEPVDNEAVMLATAEIVAHATAYARGLAPLNPAFSSDCRCSTATGLDIVDGSVDAVITSPPYPNRTDYIRHYLSAAELLLAGDESSERRLREEQIGTPLIRANETAAPLPKSVENLIDLVRTHKSYASERYYAKGFLYYFSDMKNVFNKMFNWLREDGVAILIVQDAHYKEIRIPVADLLIDIAQDSGFSLLSRKDFRVQHTLARLSPHSRASAPMKESFETAFVVQKVSR